MSCGPHGGEDRTASIWTEVFPPLAFLAVLPDFYLPRAYRSLSLLLSSFSFIVTRPQIYLWLGSPESKASLSQEWDLCHVPGDGPQRLASCESMKGLVSSLQGP